MIKLRIQTNSLDVFGKSWFLYQYVVPHKLEDAPLPQEYDVPYPVEAPRGVLVHVLVDVGGAAEGIHLEFFFAFFLLSVFGKITALPESTQVLRSIP